MLTQLDQIPLSSRLLATRSLLCNQSLSFCPMFNHKTSCRATDVENERIHTLYNAFDLLNRECTTSSPTTTAQSTPGTVQLEVNCGT